MNTYRRGPCLAVITSLFSLALSLPTLGQSPVEITQISRGPGTLQLGWANQAGTSFVIQTRDSLAEGIWITDRTHGPDPLVVGEWVAPLAPEPSTRFFQVVAVPSAQRGTVITNSVLADYTQFQLTLILGSQGIPVTPQYAVRLRKVVYETIDAQGARTQASGVVALPTTASQPLPLVSYQHGTLVTRSESPSANTFGEALIAVILASTGYAAVVPDYLGFGESPGLHPYHHAASEATACVDMLRASRALCATLGVPLTNRLFLCGYSQGGHATMALHRELETFHSTEFEVTASAPMAGAYDLSGTTAADFLSGRTMPNPYYFVYLLASYQSVYRFETALSDLLVAPYSTTLPPLLDGNHSSAEINAAMPANPSLILKPELLENFRTNRNNVLRLALRDNDTHEWAPRAPVRLYHCSGDQDVTPLNSTVALQALQAAGAASVQFIDPTPGADHGECSMPSLLAAKAWFDSLR